VANAITAWMTEYLGLAAEQLRAQGRRVDDTLLAHMSPAQSEPIGLIGTITTPARTAETSPPSDSKTSSNAPTWPKPGWNPTRTAS